MLRDRDCLTSKLIGIQSRWCQRIPDAHQRHWGDELGQGPNRFKGHEELCPPWDTHASRDGVPGQRRTTLTRSVPEGIDCSDWFHQLQFGKISANGMTMEDFWSEAGSLGL